MLHLEKGRGLIAACAAGATLLVALAVGGCAHRVRFTPKDSDSLSIKRIVRLQGVEVVDNLSRWNIKADVKNLYPGHMIFFVSEVRCLKGDVEGQLDIAYFEANAIHLSRGQTRKIAFRCLFPSPYKNAGDYTIILSRIFHNPLADGVTTDKVIATNVVWKVKPGKAI